MSQESQEAIRIRNTIIGLILLLSGAIIYSSTLISAAIYSHTLVGTEGQGWNGEHGVFGTAFREMGIIPMVIATLLGVIGIVIILSGTKWWQKQGEEISNRNRAFHANHKNGKP